MSHDLNEPPHVHIDKAGNSIKFWLDPVSQARNYGFPQKDIRIIEAKINELVGRYLASRGQAG